MSVRRLPLETLTHEHAAIITDPGTGIRVMHVTRAFVLMQAAGYLKYTLAKKGKSVFYRGQSKLYGSMVPSLYRGLKKETGRGGRNERLNRFLSTLHKDKRVLRKVSPHVREALLQHYGVRTRWLDIVDNVWVALWFACHEAVVTGRYGEFLHFERRKEPHDTIPKQVAYIVLLQSAAIGIGGESEGVYRDDASAVIDLRVAAPSQFVRPHAQHALVMQALDKSGAVSFDFEQEVVGVISVPLADALQWIGDGSLLTVHGLFPPPSFDVGYREILGSLGLSDPVLGATYHVGA